MDELIQQAAAALGWPAVMVERSARARAKAEGVTPEAVLTAWAGGGEIDASAVAPAAPAGEAPAAAPAAATPAPAEPETAEVEVLGGPAGKDEEAPAPEPEPVVVKSPPAIPVWLTATFVVVPTIALFYALFFPNGPDCGVGPQLAVDAVTGQAVGCDGTPYGVSTLDFFALGGEIYASKCEACHGPQGGGAANFPALAEGAVVNTFPSCENHVEWVALGTLQWPDPTYGANETPVGGSGAVMPGFLVGGPADLTEEELRAVVFYERVAFGGVAQADAKPDCAIGDEGILAFEAGDGGESMEAGPEDG